MIKHTHTFTAYALVLITLLLVPLQAADGPKKPIPDLTKGEELNRINERWVGPLGIYCGAWRPRQRSQEAKWVRQLLVQSVDKGSPADGVLQKGDVILGADGTGAAKVPLFEGASWAMIPIAEAITVAEARNPALLKLLIWRPGKKGQAKADPNALKAPTLDNLDFGALELGGGDALKDWRLANKKKGGEKAKAKPAKLEGKTLTVTIKLESLGRYSDTAPYNCPKSKAILRKGIEALSKSEKGDDAGFAVLCLLAADDATNPNNDRYQALAKKWVHELKPEGSPWVSGPKLMALSEYYMKTKDETIMPKLQAQAEYHAKGVSWVGTSGHRWCEPQFDGSGNGRIAGYGPISCSGTLGFLGLSLAREAGVTSAVVEKSYQAQRIFFGHYAPKSGMGYGEHPYGIGGGPGDYNGKCAMSALALSLEEGQQDKVKFFTRKAATSSYHIRQYGHGGSFFGQVFHPVAAGLGGPKATNLQFKEIRWHMDLKRRWDHTRIYDSSGNPYQSFASAATGLLFYALPLKQITITGRGKEKADEFSDTEFEELLMAKNFDPTKLSIADLIALLPKCQGMFKSSAGGELARRIKEKPETAESSKLIDQFLVLASDEKAPLHGRTGACFVLMKMKDRANAEAKSLKNADIAKGMAALLKDEVAYIRFAAVRVLQKMQPDSVRPHADAIMDAIVATGRPTFPLDEKDPLQWAHGEMGNLLVSVALKKGLDGVDRNKLIPAIRSIMETPNGGARSVSSRILSKLNKEEVLAVSDMLVDNIQISPPANAMGGALSALNSQSALANHLFEEALPLSAEYGPAAAIKAKIPQKYGKSAMELDSAKDFMRILGEQILVQAVDATAILEGSQKGASPGKLSQLKRIDGIKATESTLKLPSAQTQLIVDATNFAQRGDGQTSYTWRKVCGAGKVSFGPNASGQSKSTTVTFIDKKPGKYRFEVAMSDSLGINVLRETVDVTLYGKNGKLPANKPPKANSQTLSALPGLALPITLSGTDPDRDDLGFQVTQQPAHGTLAGVGSSLTYTADFGHNGKDSFTFVVIDGQGKTASGTVALKVSDKDVGVVLYEGFNYIHGGVNGQEGRGSFGFDGTWKNSRNSMDHYKVQRNSLKDARKNPSVSYPNLPSTGGKLTGGKHTSCSRPIDTKLFAKHGLLKPGGELWLSVFVDGIGVNLGLGGPKGHLGFNIKADHQRRICASLNGKIVGEERNAWSRSAKLRFPDDEAQMIICRYVWGKTDEDADTLEIYRVFDAPGFGPLVLKEPAATYKGMISQETFNSVSMNMDGHRAVDEIRIGTTLHSVMAGTKPLP